LQESGSCAAISEEYSGSGWRLHEPGLPMVDSDSTLIMRVNVSACAPPALPPPPLSPSWPPYLPLPAPPAPAWIPNPRRSGMEVFGLGVAAIILVVVVLTQFRYSGFTCRRRQAPAATSRCRCSGESIASSTELGAARDSQMDTTDAWACNDAALAASRGERVCFGTSATAVHENGEPQGKSHGKPRNNVRKTHGKTKPPESSARVRSRMHNVQEEPAEAQSLAGHPHAVTDIPHTQTPHTETPHTETRSADGNCALTEAQPLRM